MVMDANLVADHTLGMTIKPEGLLPQHIYAEMRPERIGHRLMLLREALGLKSAEMADLLGINRTYWSRFEGGKRAITEPVAALLDLRFGVSLDFLYLGKWDRLPLDLATKMRSVEARLSSKS